LWTTRSEPSGSEPSASFPGVVLGWLSAAFPQLLARCPRSCREQLPYAEVEVDAGERRRDERTGLGGAADGDNNTWLRGPAPVGAENPVTATDQHLFAASRRRDYGPQDLTA
jgi:hypothetical protein